MKDAAELIVGGLLGALGLLVAWKRLTVSWFLARWCQRHSRRFPWLYPGPLRRWSTSERLWRVVAVSVALVWAVGGLWFAILGVDLAQA